MSALKRLKDALDSLLGVPPLIEGTQLKAIDPLLSLEFTLQLIGEVRQDPEALAIIAARSYTHSLGFKKITLLEPTIELASGGKSWYQVRLHLWTGNENNAVPMVEAKHEHSFDFISRVLVGEMENQCYTVHQLDCVGQSLLEKVQAALIGMSDADRTLVHKSVQALETISLAGLGSKQAAAEGLAVDRAHLVALLGLSDEELDLVVRLNGRYEYDAVASTFGGNYVHKLTGAIELKPSVVLDLKAGDLYHHPNAFIHRLFIPRQPNATIIVTTPRTHGVNGASFQHPTWFSGDNASYPRRMYSVEELLQGLSSFEELLKKTQVGASGRLLDVGAAQSIP